MRTAALAALPLATTVVSARAQTAADTVPLTLREAVVRAVEQSEEVRLARSQVALAGAQVTAARAAALPQVSANLGYTRTFESAFSGGGGIQLPDSLRFSPDSTASLEERVRYLEQNAPTAGLAGIGGLFGNLPFGQKNAYAATISGSQLLYSGGRVGAAMEIARDYREAARLGLTEEIAEIRLQVETAYYRALLARELESSAQAALTQAEEFLAEERLRLSAGRASELDVLRAEVALENIRPQLVAARNANDLALLNLKRLVDVPLTQPVALTSRLEVPPADVLAAERLDADVLAAQRAAVLAAQRQVEIREQQVRIARGAFLPNLALQMSYGRQLFPADALQLDGDWRTDWTATLGVQIPIFSGGKRFAEVEQAQVQLGQARLQLAQLREAVQLQYEQALGEKERARTAIAARQRTVQVAQRVYDLTVLRYEQGLATQLEVSEARLSLLQARTNLAQALADFYVADAGLVRATGGEDPGALPGQPPIPDTQPVGEPAPAPPARPEAAPQTTG